MLNKQALLVAALIVASLVTPSAATSAWAMPIESLRRLSEAEQRTIVNRIIEEVFPHEAVERMQAIARCESRGRHVVRDGSLLQNPTGAYHGALQVAVSVHANQIERLRREHNLQVLSDLHDYVRFNLILYLRDRQLGGDGFRPWPRCRRRTAGTSPVQVAEAR